MVRDVLERITAPVRGAVMRPIRSLHQAAYLLALLTLASQVLALLRDRTFAHLFGVGQTLDLYYAAFKVPDLVFALISSLVSAYVLIPRIAGLEKGGVQTLVSESITFLVGVGGALSVLLALWMPQFLMATYPSLMASSSATDFVFLSRLLLLQPILLGVSGVLGSVTQVHRRFVLFALSPVLYNLGIIVGTLLWYPRLGIVGIGLGVIVGSIAYLVVNIPVLVEVRVILRIRWPRLSDFLPVIRDSVPRSLALGMGSITALALTSIASRLGSGAVSVFTFAGNLEAVPLSLIGASYAVAAFPALSEASARERRGEFTEILSASARHIIIWSCVAIGLVVVLRAHLVRMILGSGAFDWSATRLTAALLAILVVGLCAQGLVLLFSRALYAVRQSWRPLLYQLIGGVLTVGAAVLLLAPWARGVLTWVSALLKVSDVSGTTVLFIAAASTIGQLFLLWLSLAALHTVTPRLLPSLRRSFVDGALAAIAGGFFAYGTLLLVGGLAPLTTLFAVVWQGASAAASGLVGAAAALWLVDNKEFMTVFVSMRRLVRPVGPRSAALEPSGDEPLSL